MPKRVAPLIVPVIYYLGIVLTGDIMNKREALYNCIISEYPDIDKVLKNNTKITLDNLLDVISMREYNIAKDLGYSAGGIAKLIKRFWPDKPSTSKKLCTYLLFKKGLSFCIKCEKVYAITNFYLNKDKKVSYCKKCSDKLTAPSQAYRTSLYRSAKIHATPSWANLQKISDIYENCPEGYHVDHIIPLNGVNICGLHLETNLQYLLAKDNCSKGNKFSE